MKGGLKMKLKLSKKTAYGVRRYYPECKASRLVLTLMNQETFTDVQIGMLKELGFELENVTPVDPI